MHLEHVNYTVADLDRTIDFYERLLGLKVRWRREATAELPAAAHIGTDNWYIALFQASRDGRVGGKPYDEPGFNHIGVVVDDLDATRARLIELGITPGSEADYDPGRRLYFHDPEGFEVELVQYAAQPA